MKMARRRLERVRVSAGFAVDGDRGVLYAMVEKAGRESLVRVGFTCRPRPELQGRDVAYYAIDALVVELLARGVRRVELLIDDERLPLDLAERRALPSSLIVPYVALRCKLNRFAAATLRSDGKAARDLTARARAEISFNLAA